MKYPWIDEYLLSQRGVTKDFQPEWNWIRYYIGGKMFAAVCRGDADQPVYITLKLEPTEGEFWRGQYPDVIPGYYMNKLHWNSVKADCEVPGGLGTHQLCRGLCSVPVGRSGAHQLPAKAVESQRRAAQCGSILLPPPHRESRPKSRTHTDRRHGCLPAGRGHPGSVSAH